MTQLEYLVALVSIIVALAMADLAGSFRELVRPRRSVRWHWLPLTWAIIVLLVLVEFWWASFSALRAEVFGRAIGFLPYLAASMTLYLACAFALPDPECRPDCAPERVQEKASPEGLLAIQETETLNMEAFYFSPTHRQWFFGTLIVLLALGQGISMISSLSFGNAKVYSSTLSVLTNGAAMSLLWILITTDRNWVHASLTVLTLAIAAYRVTVAATGLH